MERVGSASGSNQLALSTERQVRIPPKRYIPIPDDRIPYKQRVIGIWRHPDTKQAMSAQLIGPHVDPDLNYRKTHNFTTRAVIEHGLLILVYLDEKDDKVLGAKLPRDLSGKY